MNSAQPNHIGFVLWVAWGALLFAILTYAIVLQNQDGIENGASSREGGFNEPFTRVLGFVGVGAIVASFLVRQVVTIPASKINTPAAKGKVMTGSIISFALAESVAIYGLVLGLTGGSFQVSSVFFVASFVALALQAPIYVSPKPSRP